MEPGLDPHSTRFNANVSNSDRGEPREAGLYYSGGGNVRNERIKCGSALFFLFRVPVTHPVLALARCSCPLLPPSVGTALAHCSLPGVTPNFLISSMPSRGRKIRKLGGFRMLALASLRFVCSVCPFSTTNSGTLQVEDWPSRKKKALVCSLSISYPYP